jgi:hypothetical protein
MKDSKVLEKAKLQRAQKIWEVVKTYPIGIIKKSLLIDYIISEGGNKHWEGELKNVADLPMDMRHTLEKIRGAETQKQALKKMLS